MHLCQQLPSALRQPVPGGIMAPQDQYMFGVGLAPAHSAPQKVPVVFGVTPAVAFEAVPAATLALAPAIAETQSLTLYHAAS
jgi:hypothetical protein